MLITVEDEIRHHLLAAKVDKMTVVTQSKIVNAVIDSKDVQLCHYSNGYG